MPSHTVTGLNWQRTISIPSFTAKSSFLRRLQLRRRQRGKSFATASASSSGVSLVGFLRARICLRVVGRCARSSSRCFGSKTLKEHDRIVNTQKLASFCVRDAGVGGYVVVVIEARLGSPARNVAAAIVGEKPLKGRNDRSSLRIARRDGTAHAGIAALELHFAYAKRHENVLIRGEKLIFPKGRDAVDFQRVAKTQPHVAQGKSGEQGCNCLERSGRNDRRTVGDGVIGEAFGSIAHGDRLVEKSAKPLRCVHRAAGELESFRGSAAAVGYGKGNGAEVRCVSRPNQVNGSGALPVHPLAVRRIQGPGAVEFQPAARPDTRFLDLHGVKRLDRVQLNDGKPRRHRRGFHGQILAKLSGQEGPAEASLWKFNPRRETGPGPHAQERRRPARRSRSSAACRSENIRQSARI